MKVYTADGDLGDYPLVTAAWDELNRESFKELVLKHLAREGIPHPDNATNRLSLCEWEYDTFDQWVRAETTVDAFREANYLDLCWTYPGEWIELKPGEREPNPFGSSSPLVTESDLDAYPLGDPKRIALERELEKRRR